MHEPAAPDQRRQRQDKILALAARSAGLEPSAAERAGWQTAADSVANAFLGELPTMRTYTPTAPDTVASFADATAGQHAVEELLPLLAQGLTAAGIRTAGAGHLAFVPGGGLYAGAVADHLAATFNLFSADAFSSPVAVHIHEEAIRLLTAMVGYDADAWGDITSGGSHATLTAFYVARQTAGLRARDFERTCVYLSEHTHHCVEKALRVLFGNELCIRKVGLIEHRLDPAALRASIVSDKAAGLLPWLVVATAGSTNLGLVDPLAELASIAREFGLWLHVDGACGGFFALCPEMADKFAGLAAADSIVLDPHKGMFLPYGCGAVVFKRGELLRASLSHTGVYLQDRSSAEQKSPMDYSLELTRPFRSLRLWLALKIHGIDQIRDALSEKLLLTAHCRDELGDIPGIVLHGALDLSIFAFRYADPALSAAANDELTRQLLKAINAHPEAFLSSTIVDGRFVIRVAVLSFRTHLPTITSLIATVRSEAALLAKRGA